MSRTFPIRRPSRDNATPSVLASTRPLQISRPIPISQPTTPLSVSASPPQIAPRTAPSGPSRPPRSDLRARGLDDQISERNSTSESPRESYITSRSDATASSKTRGGSHSVSYNVGDTLRSPRRMGTASSSEGDTTAASHLSSALAAFQSAGARRRQMTLGSDETNHARDRQQALEAEKARQRRIQEKAPGRRRRATRAGDIDAILDQVMDGWEFVVDPDFSHVDLALQLLDTSSLGKDMESFRRTKEKLSNALKGSVDKHYQAFAASLPHHSSLIFHLGTAQVQIAGIRNSLLETKDALGSKRADLVQLYSRAETLDEMMRLLDQIEHLKSVPDLLETLISEKRLLQAAILLMRSLKIINKPEMLDIGAVSDLRGYLNGQEHALRDILVDELQNHLYLKSLWCEARWTTYIPNQSTYRKPECEDQEAHSPEEALSCLSSRATRLSRFLDDLVLRPNDPPHNLTEIFQSSTDHHPNSTSAIPKALNITMPSAPGPEKGNPEGDSFMYMETLLESLAVLGQLGTGLDFVSQRLPAEIHALVESTLEEVEERTALGERMLSKSFNTGSGKSGGVYLLTPNNFPSSGNSYQSSFERHFKTSDLRLSALESSAKEFDHEILRDLFWTLYSKLDAVAQGLRVVSEVASRIGSRRDFRDSSGAKAGVLFPLADAWVFVRDEVHTLISDYLTDGQQGTVSGRNPVSSINEILRDGKYAKDRIKANFRFGDTDLKKMNKVLKPHEEGLTLALKDTMPGLVSGTSGDSVQVARANARDDKNIRSDQQHRLLVPPDAFLVTILFQPTLTFLERIGNILPSGTELARASSTMLDDFVLKVFLPQLEDKILDHFHEIVAESEAFQIDPLSLQFSPQPLLKASTSLLALINSLCVILRTSPFHRENYSRLILGVVIQFYQRCNDRFQYLASNASPCGSGLESESTFAAQWAQNPQLQICLSDLFNDLGDPEKQRQSCLHEDSIELLLLEGKTVNRDDLVPSMQNLASLAVLYRSVTWFAEELNALKDDEDVMASPDNVEVSDDLSARFIMSSMPVMSTKASLTRLTLPLSKEMAMRFQALLQTYEQLSSLILNTIRIELRCRVIFYLDSAMRYGTYSSSYEASEPDPHILDLSAELVLCDEIITSSLPEKGQRFIFMGLGGLMEQLLILNARLLSRPNDFGVRKVVRNILALQQCTSSLTSNGGIEFGKAKRFYSLYFLGPQDMLDQIRQKQEFSFDNYQTMLGLQCGVRPEDASTGAAQSLDRNYSSYVIDLHGLELESPRL